MADTTANGELLQTTKQNISLHTSNIFKEKELEKIQLSRIP